MPLVPLFVMAVHLAGAALLRGIKPNLYSATFLALSVISVTGYLGVEYGDQVLAMAHHGRDRLLVATGVEPEWPPAVGLGFPRQKFVTAAGQSLELTQFRGKVVLVHLIGTPSRTSVAFAGGKLAGTYQGVAAQEGLESIATYARHFAGVRMEDPRLVVLHLILFNKQMRAPTRDELRDWETHFGVDHRDNEIVAGGDSRLATATSRQLVPGFWLLDQDAILRAAATGAEPEFDLYQELLPMMGRLLAE